MKVYIFGAHSRARTTSVYLQESNNGCEVAAYLYDNDEANPEEIDGAPVIFIGEMCNQSPNSDGICNHALDTGCPVYIATRGVYHDEVAERLRALGFSDIRPVTVELDTKLRNEYVKNIFGKRNISFRRIEELEAGKGAYTSTQAAKPVHTETLIMRPFSARIYEVRSIYDKPLEKDTYIKQPYESSIQVGAALTNKRLSECTFFDNEGDNISDTNKQMCETTALYWMWKNAPEKEADDYLGLVHYRRHFILPADWAERMYDNDIDMLLPVPMYIGPSIAENFKFRHVSKDWDTLMDVIAENSEEIFKQAEQCFDDTVFFPCNMVIVRRRVLDDFCKWAFPILLTVKERGGTHDDTYQNRYPAFMGERLLTLYWYMHHDDLNVVYADKKFLM